MGCGRGCLAQTTHSRDGKATLIEIPYSEHSSFGELEAFCKHFLSRTPHVDIIPTVNVAPASRRKMRRFLTKWAREAQTEAHHAKA